MAEIYNLPKTGVSGILMRAKKYKMINEVRPLLEEPGKQAKVWIAQPLYENILIKTGELKHL
ncbi:MAG: DUF3368 domain-containing protein [Desulfococcaceae bacterium]